MIIKYIHATQPEMEKTYDTEKVLRNNPFISISQKEFDEMELNRIQKDKNVLSYKVLK